MSHWHFAKVIRNCTMLEKNIRTLRMNITFYNSSFMVFLSWKFVSCSGGQKYPLWYFGRDNECCGAPNCSLELRFAERQDLLTPWNSLFFWYIVKKFPTFSGTRSFVTVFSRIRHWSFSQASYTHSIIFHPLSWRRILILSAHYIRVLITVSLTEP